MLDELKKTLMTWYETNSNHALFIQKFYYPVEHVYQTALHSPFCASLINGVCTVNITLYGLYNKLGQRLYILKQRRFSYRIRSFFKDDDFHKRYLQSFKVLFQTFVASIKMRSSPLICGDEPSAAVI